VLKINEKGYEYQNYSTLFSLSEEFLEAARVLQSTPPRRVGYKSSIYYLLGHSAELSLKAFLFKHGKSIKYLRKINHDLGALVAEVREEGLNDNVCLEQIGCIAGEYEQKSFEYRTNKTKSLPNMNLMIEEVEKLQEVVLDYTW